MQQINREPSRDHSSPSVSPLGSAGSLGNRELGPDAQFGPQAQVRVYNMRCPSCAKLYRVDAKDIVSSSPHFDCQACRTQFTFDYPPRHPHAIPTRPLKLPQFSPVSELDFENDIPKEFVRKCPKCGAFNTKAAEDCHKCHVILARAEGMALEPKSGALPSLIRAWQELLSDYENVTKHIAFVDRCEDLQAIPFALKKYQALKEAQPHDDVARKMFEQVWMKSLVHGADRMVRASEIRRYIADFKGSRFYKKLYKSVVLSVNWPRVIKISPWALYTLLILVGMTSASLRNLVGIGASLFFMHLGLRLFFKGRVGLDDFI
jgi:hypothetical protein